jgi:thioredoxin-related protein
VRSSDGLGCAALNPGEATMDANGEVTGGDVWLGSYAEASERAKRLRRPLLVDFWDPTCLGCLKMLDVTFPNPEVDELLRAEFVCLKVNTAELPDDAKPLVRAHRLIWTPDLLFLDPTGAQLGRRLGFHPPAEFVAVLRIALGQTAMAYRDYERAQQQFTLAAEHAGAADTRPEALFWAGIAAYKLGGGDRAILRREWAVLRDEYPASPWWTRAEASWGTPSPGELSVEEPALAAA